MIESEKKIRDLQKNLNSEDEKVISDAIISVRNEDPFRGAIKLLTGLFDTTNNLTIKGLIRNFLNDVKEPEVRAEVVTEAMKPYKPETISILVSSCWQSGLDYSQYAADFAYLYMHSDYLTALECFTVIEESAGNISPMDKNKIIALLNDNREKSSVEKKSLTEALIAVLK
jgi:hypothetical protein